MIDEFLSPEKILDELELGSDTVAADFGCGSGGFAIPLAKRLENGFVYVIDVQKTPLSVLKGRFFPEKITNIKIIHSDLEKPGGSTLTDSSVDLVLMINILFQTEKKDNIFSEAEKILKKDGKLLVIDWLPESAQGPVKNRISSEKIKEIAEKFKLKPEKEFKAGKYHYGIIFAKP